MNPFIEALARNHKATEEVLSALLQLEKTMRRAEQLIHQAEKNELLRLLYE